MVPTEPKKKGDAGKQSLVDKISSYFVNPFKKAAPPKQPIGGFGERVKNIVRNNFRGLIGVIVPLCFLLPQVKKYDQPDKLELMWMWMVWFYLVQPVAVPATSLIPIFVLPMGGVVKSAVVCKSYMNETVMLYVLTGYLIVLLNNSGVDKRIALWFLCSGEARQFSGAKLVLKCSTAAFFLSMVSSRLIVTFTLTQLMTEAFGKLPPGKKGSAVPNFTTMNYIINNSIQTSAGIGSTALMHASFINILFRGCYQELAPVGMEYPDIFNFLQYSAFAFPVAFVMFIVNFCYHMVLLKGADAKHMSEAHMAELRKVLMRNKAEIPAKISLHEKFSIFFTILLLSVLFTRWNKWFEGWGSFSSDSLSPDIPRCKDATACACFVIILHILPKSFGFLKLLQAKKKSEVPPHKPESAILWWRFVDKNVNYGYIFTFGSAFAILNSSTITHLDHIIGETTGPHITNQSWNVGLAISVFIAAVLCNVMTAIAACSMWLPFVLVMSVDGAGLWPLHVYIAALGVGIASNFGFCVPFQYTPAYYCHHTGKVPISKMVKYSIPSVLICFVILTAALVTYAAFLWDPDSIGFSPLIPFNSEIKPTLPPEGAPPPVPPPP